VTNEQDQQEEQSANALLLAAFLRNQIYLLLVAARLRTNVTNVIDKTEQRLADKIRARLYRDKGLITPNDVAKMEVVLQELKAIRKKAWDEAETLVKEELSAVAKQEQKTSLAILNTVAPVLLALRKGDVLSITKAVFEGRSVRDWAKNAAQEDLRRIENAVRVSVMAGGSTDDIVKQVVGTERANGTEGVTEVTRNQIGAITRTLVVDVASKARDLFIRENKEVFKKERYVAVLDSRTTAVCRGNDGKIFDVGVGPHPPLHWNCRSMRVPVLDSDILATRPTKTAVEKRIWADFVAQNNVDIKNASDLPRNLANSYKDYVKLKVKEQVGSVPAATTYQEWLSKQSKSFQEDVLGKTKAKLFREGGLQLDQYVSKIGKELTLKELAQKHKQEFIAAGLNPDDFL
jgi:SPP1 gp7 family putative phage head morphogenesis protein